MRDHIEAVFSRVGVSARFRGCPVRPPGSSPAASPEGPAPRRGGRCDGRGEQPVRGEGAGLSWAGLGRAGRHGRVPAGAGGGRSRSPSAIHSAAGGGGCAYPPARAPQSRGAAPRTPIWPTRPLTPTWRASSPTSKVGGPGDGGGFSLGVGGCCFFGLNREKVEVAAGQRGAARAPRKHRAGLGGVGLSPPEGPAAPRLFPLLPP